MKQSTKDSLTGSLHIAKGAAKEAAGQITNNPELAAEGELDKLTGKLQKALGTVERVLEK